MGGTTVDFSYFFGGLRKTKTSGGVTKNYYYDGDRLIAEKWSTGAYLLYHYDETGSPYAITYSATGGGYAKYYLIKNLQGDVLQIRNVNNVVVANYEYDAWGKVVSIKYANGNDINVSNHIGVINPIRYRGYYYDSETGFYYLKSRYYDPAICRFISADTQIDIDDIGTNLNLFAYCINDPVNGFDPNGRSVSDIIKWVAKNVVRPTVKKVEEALSKVDFTYSRGINIGVTPGIWNFNIQYGIAFDSKGNISLQGAINGGVTTSSSPGFSLCQYNSIFNAPSIDQMGNECYQIGGSIGIPISGIPTSFGGDFNMVPDQDNNDKVYWGITTSTGLGSPGCEFHADWGASSPPDIIQVNIFDLSRKIYRDIMEW